MVSALPRKETSQEILRLFDNLQKPLEKQGFEQCGRQVPEKETVRPPAVHPGITLMYYENHWENKGFRMSVRMKHGGSSRVPLRGMGNLTVIRKPLKTIGKAWFSQANCAKCQEHTEGSACVELGRCIPRK